MDLEREAAMMLARVTRRGTVLAGTGRVFAG
jgi:hypothetical protein